MPPLLPHDDAFSGARAATHRCDVCQTYKADETGRCPLCAPGSSGRSGDIINDLAAHRDHGRESEPRHGIAEARRH